MLSSLSSLKRSFHQHEHLLAQGLDITFFFGYASTDLTAAANNTVLPYNTPLPSFPQFCLQSLSARRLCRSSLSPWRGIKIHRSLCLCLLRLWFRLAVIMTQRLFHSPNPLSHRVSLPPSNMLLLLPYSLTRFSSSRLVPFLSTVILAPLSPPYSSRHLFLSAPARLPLPFRHCTAPPPSPHYLRYVNHT